MLLILLLVHFVLLLFVGKLLLLLLLTFSIKVFLTLDKLPVYVRLAWHNFYLESAFTIVAVASRVLNPGGLSCRRNSTKHATTYKLVE